MIKRHTADYLAMARSMAYGDLVRKFRKRWNSGSLGAGIILFLYA